MVVLTFERQSLSIDSSLTVDRGALYKRCVDGKRGGRDAQGVRIDLFLRIAGAR